MSSEGYEKRFVAEAFDTNWIAPLGKNVTEFENELARYLDVGYAAALSSGTAAIHLALRYAGVGAGDIVFCPSLTFSATANPILYQNATPVFIDSDFSTWNMHPAALEEAFYRCPHVKAVLVVHLYGLCPDMDRIVNLCERHGVPLIEDAAESLGSKYKGKHTGTIGNLGVLSFNGNKIITTSGGGMLVSDDKAAIEKARFWSTQSRDPAPYYQHSELGYNYRMSNVAAGIGRGQLMVLNDRVTKKREIFDFYKAAFADLDGITMMPVPAWSEPNCWLSCAYLNGKVRSKEIIDALEEHNIESKPTWKPMHMQPLFERFDFIGEGVSQSLFENGVCLPSDTKMTQEDLQTIAAIIKTLWR